MTQAYWWRFSGIFRTRAGRFLVHCAGVLTYQERWHGDDRCRFRPAMSQHSGAVRSPRALPSTHPAKSRSHSVEFSVWTHPRALSNGYIASKYALKALPDINCRLVDPLKSGNQPFRDARRHRCKRASTAKTIELRSGKSSAAGSDRIEPACVRPTADRRGDRHLYSARPTKLFAQEQRQGKRNSSSASPPVGPNAQAAKWRALETFPGSQKLVEGTVPLI